MSIEAQLTETLAARAEGEVDTGLLLSRATARGRRRKAVRNGGFALAAVAVLGITLAVPSMLPDKKAAPEQHAAPPPATTAPVLTAPTTPAPVALPLLPPATGKPTLVENPALIGKDPGLVHLSLDTLPAGANSVVGWGSGSGSEFFTVGSPAVVDFTAGEWATKDINGRQPHHEIQIKGKTAKVYQQEREIIVLWEPLPGVKVAGRSVNGATEAELVAIAEQLRLDRVFSCVPKFTPTFKPSGATLNRCDTETVASGIGGGRQVYEGPSGSRLEVRDNPYSAGLHGITGEAVMVAGHPGVWGSGDLQGRPGNVLNVYNWNGRDVTIMVNGNWGKADAIAFAEGMRWP